MTHLICLDSNLGLLDQSAGKDLGKLDLLCISEVEIQNQIFLEYKKEVINLVSVQPLICSGSGRGKGVSTGGWVGFKDDSWLAAFVPTAACGNHKPWQVDH